MNYIKEIAEALSENHAALMVGAGFSKNAEKIAATEKTFLNWNELSDKFYETVYENNNYPGKEYNSPLRLAQEVEITVGRPKLEKIIKDAVPDLEYAPSDVYVNLLKMPWKDVFTTNYDTLLERAADKVTDRRYNVVTSQEDLVNSNDAPRILKLHGSFPSQRPFIITEEDYRTYPIKFAAMVNTVQQALLENVFCMLGFSCEDPNFTNWIGWIHDNLGKSSSQKMYMVSVSHVAEAKRKLLFERNIIVVDLEEFWPTESIEERLKIFLEKLNSIVEEKQNNNNWFNDRKVNLQFDTDFEKKIEIMKQLNDSYPGWIFLPWKMKSKVNPLLNKIDVMYKFDENAIEKQLDFMYEYVKLMDISGRPILLQVVEQFWNVLEKKECIELEKRMKEVKYKNQVIYLHLLRSYRELGEWENYDKCHKKIEEAYLDYDNKQFFKACDCWKELFRFETEKLRETLDSWNLAKGDVYWPMIKASIYALIGEISKADEMLMETLTLARRQLVKKSGNEYLYSIEESIVSLINFIRHGNMLSTESEKSIHNGDVSWWGENDKYYLYLGMETKNNESFQSRNNYDLSSSYTIHMGTDNTQVFYALEYFRFLEQTGHPFRIQNVTNTRGLHSAVKQLAQYYPHWCFMQILIARDNKHLDLMFGRTKLSELSQKDVDEITEEYLRILKVLIKNVKPENYFFANSIYDQAAAVLPEIIARFCYKCSINVLDEIFDLMFELCLSDVRDNFKGIEQIFRVLFNAFSTEEQIQRIEKILQFPIETDRISNYRDPMVFVSIPKEKIKLDSEIYNIAMYQIKQVIRNAKDEKRECAINRLFILARIIILNDKDKEYLYGVLEEKDTVENKLKLYILDSKKYKEKTKEIFEDTLTKMTKDSDTKTFPLMGNDYGSLIAILKNIDIQIIDLEKTFDIMKGLVLSNQKMVKNRQAGQGAKETIRQTFLISIGLLILKKKDSNLSETEAENVQEYFKILKNIYQNSIVIEMAEASLIYNTNSKFKFEDFQNRIWLSSEQEFDLFKDFFDMIYVNHFELEDNDIMVKCADIIFKNLIYKVMSSERCVNISALNVCASLINAGIDIKNEIQILLTCLFKLYKETAIEQTDSEQETLHKLRCRILSCKIAKELYRRGIQAEILEDWKKISEDENEFVELRNINFDRD